MKMNCVELRDRAILMFLNSTGCRVGEVERLNKRDIDFRNLECKVLGKGNKERIVFIDDVAATILKDYLDSRNDDNEALFVSEDSRHAEAHRESIRRQECSSAQVPADAGDTSDIKWNACAGSRGDPGTREDRHNDEVCLHEQG